MSPKPHHPKYPAWSGLRAAQKAAPKRTDGSWWCAFATGERRDAEFMSKAESLIPAPSKGFPLRTWTSEVA